jgi:hypothetical protein
MRPEVKEKPKPDPDQNNPTYAEYFALSLYHRRCLDATNYWAVIGGQKVIAVPPSDKLYHKYFDPRCYNIRKEKEGGKPSPQPSPQPSTAPAPPHKSAHTPAPKDPKKCDAHAPVPNGKGGFKCERCDTELVSKAPVKKDVGAAINLDGFCVCKIAQRDRKYKKVGLEWHCFYCGKSFDPDSLYGSSPTDSAVVKKLKATKSTKPAKPTTPELF